MTLPLANASEAEDPSKFFLDLRDLILDPYFLLRSTYMQTSQIYNIITMQQFSFFFKLLIGLL
jgi:hypothetical protein